MEAKLEAKVTLLREFAGFIFDRIAADAQRIAELNKEVEDTEYVYRVTQLKRDEYKRELDAATERERARWAREQEQDARIAELESENASLKAETDRISELRQDAIDELVRVGRERDEARRAAEALDVRNKGLLLELAQSATSQGEGLVSAVTNSEDSSPSPAPIPLGAVVEVEGDPCAPYVREDGCWIDSDRDAFPDTDEYGRGPLVSSLYRARHPVATRETVERVAAVFAGAMVAGFVPNDCARRVLRALGYEVAE